jgi:hypothetical protein
MYDMVIACGRPIFDIGQMTFRELAVFWLQVISVIPRNIYYILILNVNGESLDRIRDLLNSRLIMYTPSFLPRM